MFWSIVALGLMVQFCLLAATLPLSAVFQDQTSFFAIDHPYHLYQIEAGRHLLRLGRLVGFDPYFGAGYAGGVTFNASAKIPMVAAALLPSWISTRNVYLIHVACCALIPVVAIAAAARVRSWSNAHLALLTAFGLAAWWVSALHWYHTAGMVSFVAAAYCAIPFSFWVWKTCSSEENVSFARLMAIGISGGIGLWLHPLFPVPVIALTSALALMNWGRFSSRFLVLRGLWIAAIAGLVNVPWVLASLEHPSFASLQSYQREVGWHVVLNPLLHVGSDSMASIVNPISVGTCLVSLALVRGSARREMIALILAGVMLAIFAGFAAGVGHFERVQPNRFVAVGYLLIALAAAYGLGRVNTKAHVSATIRGWRSRESSTSKSRTVCPASEATSA